MTGAGDYRFFAGWRSDPFFCDVEGTKNNLQFTGDDFMAHGLPCERFTSALAGRRASLGVGAVG